MQRNSAGIKAMYLRYHQLQDNQSLLQKKKYQQNAFCTVQGMVSMENEQRLGILLHCLNTMSWQ